MAISTDETYERISRLVFEKGQFLHNFENFKEDINEIIEKFPIKEIPQLIQKLTNLKALKYDEIVESEYVKKVQYWTEQASNPFGSQSSSISDYCDNEVRAEHRGLLERLRKSPGEKERINIERKRRIGWVIEKLREIQNI